MNLTRLTVRLLLGRRLPKTSGELVVAGISHAVTIRRDAYGIPYVEAENDLDAWYGVGFCQGQDRPLQIEMLARAASGRLAELVGATALPMDRLSRRLGFSRAARLQERALEEDDRMMIAAFARGLTEGASIGCPKPAHGYALLRARPMSFDAVDILAGFNYISFALSAWSGKLSRLLILQADGPEAVKALDDDYAEWIPVTRPVSAPAGRAVDRLGQDLARLTGFIGTTGASNNWALDESRTRTGRPILANDPHLAPTLPAPWYLVHVRTPEWAVAGASFVGAPLIPSGHNEVAAWGVTAGFADNIDLYLEELGPDGRSVRQGNGFVACEVSRETILVRGESPVVEEVLITGRGPIISPALQTDAGIISLRATWMKPGGFKGLTRYHHATSFDDFRRTSAHSTRASLNMVYADTAGTVGWQLIGEVPRRRCAWGTLPLPGWDDECQWLDEPIPDELMPYVHDPEQGFVATANNKPVQDGEGPYLGMDWPDGYRQARIVEALAERRDWDVAATMALQLDQRSVPWREMRDAVLGVSPESDRARRAKQMLKAWDGVLAADSVGATVYSYFLTTLAARLIREKAPNSIEWALGKGFNPMVPRAYFAIRRVSQLVRLLREQPPGWLRAPWSTVISGALDAAVEKLENDLGPVSRAWSWGHVRPLTLLHPLAARPPLNRLFNVGPFPWGGDGQTISAAGRQFSDPAANPPVIANMRVVVDVGNWEESRFVLAGGQSGNPFSPHYDDLLALWKRGEGVPIRWSKEMVARVAVTTLRLLPP